MAWIKAKLRMTIYVEALKGRKKSFHIHKVSIAPMRTRKFALSFQKLLTNVKFDKLNKKFCVCHYVFLPSCLPPANNELSTELLRIFPQSTWGEFKINFSTTDFLALRVSERMEKVFFDKNTSRWSLETIKRFNWIHERSNNLCDFAKVKSSYLLEGLENTNKFLNVFRIIQVEQSQKSGLKK